MNTADAVNDDDYIPGGLTPVQSAGACFLVAGYLAIAAVGVLWPQLARGQSANKAGTKELDAKFCAADLLAVGVTPEERGQASVQAQRIASEFCGSRQHLTKRELTDVYAPYLFKLASDSSSPVDKRLLSGLHAVAIGQ